MSSKRTIYCLLLLAVILRLPVAAQTGDNPCTAINLMMLDPDPAIAVIAFDNNSSAGNDPFALPDCGSQNHTLYFNFMLPPGYTHFELKYDPLDGQPGEISLFDQSLCGAPGPGSFTGLDACGMAGEPLVITNVGTGICLEDMEPYLLKVSGPGGSFMLDIIAIPPTCFDGCQNGTEVGVDSLPPLNIMTSSGGTTICLGDAIGLGVGPVPTGANYLWSTGETTPNILINFPGIYGLEIQYPDGCIQFGEIEILADSNCVWPGEVNKDFFVDAKDVLPIGIAYGLNGPPRSGTLPPLAWLPQAAADFSRDFGGFLDLVNTKHADCNGDGIIDLNDLAAIDANYGLQPIFRAAPSARGAATDPPLFIEFEEDSVEVGDTIVGTVFLGDSGSIVSNLYGYSFDLLLPVAFIDTNYFEIDHSDSWLNDDTTFKIEYHKFEPTGGFVDIGYTRTDSTMRTGSGELFKFKVVVEDNLDGRLTKERSLHFDFADPLANTVNPDSIGISLRADSVLAAEFCDSKGLSSTDEWIDGFIVAGKKVLSGNNGGYREVTVTSGHIKTGNSYTWYFKPGFSGAKHDMHWRMWVDFNLDGDLDDVGEMVMDTVSDTIVSTVMAVPLTAELGWTTIRIQAKDYDGIPPAACEDFAEGEVEDYIVEIRSGSPRIQPAQADRLVLFPNPTTGRVNLNLGLTEAELLKTDGLAELSIADLSGKVHWNYKGLSIEEGSLQLDLGGLPNGLYLLEVRCGDKLSVGKLSIVH